MTKSIIGLVHTEYENLYWLSIEVKSRPFGFLETHWCMLKVLSFYSDNSIKNTVLRLKLQYKASTDKMA